MRYAIAMLLVFALAGSCFAADIVTVPTANQLKQGQVDVAYYYVSLNFDAPAPQHVHAQTVYFGLTDRIELDAHRYDIDGVSASTIINASVLLMSETVTIPDVVIGGRNLGGSEVGGVPGSDKRSWYVAAAKTLNLPQYGAPELPIIRLHAGLGTEDLTLFEEPRHKGLFGGVQALLTPDIGAVALHDGQDIITGLTYSPQGSGLTIKGGKFGSHWWAGLSWAR